MILTLCLYFLCGLITVLPGAPSAPTDEQTLTLGTALSRALTHHPALSAAQAAIDAGDGAVRQAGLLPNPSLAVEVENFLGGESFSGFDSAETTVNITQELLINGLRGRRITLAEAERDRAGLELRGTRTRLTGEVLRAYLAALATQERARIRAELARTARAVADAVHLRVEAGKVSPLEEARARIGVSQAQIASAEAAAERDRAFAALSGYWGELSPDFTSVAGRLDGIIDPERFAAAEQDLANSPELQKEVSTLRIRAAEIGIEQARALPGVSIAGGARRLHEWGTTAFTAGISFDLPLFDRNQGALAAATARKRQAEYEREAVELSLRSRFFGALRDLRRAAETARGYRQDLLPAADKLLNDIRVGYEAGKFTYLDLLDLQRTLAELRETQLDALVAYHQAAIELLTLAAFPDHLNLPSPSSYFGANDHE